MQILRTGLAVMMVSYTIFLPATVQADEFSGGMPGMSAQPPALTQAEAAAKNSATSYPQVPWPTYDQPGYSGSTLSPATPESDSSITEISRDGETSEEDKAVVGMINELPSTPMIDSNDMPANTDISRDGMTDEEDDALLGNATVLPPAPMIYPTAPSTSTDINRDGMMGDQDKAMLLTY